MIIYLIIIFIILLTIIHLHITSDNINRSKLKYSKCPDKNISPIINEIFTNNNIIRTYRSDWDIYMPCTYTFLNQEFSDFDKRHSKKIIFGIYDCDEIVSKNNLWKILEKNYGREISKQIMPETYILSDKKHMDLFKKKFNPNKLYLLKKNIQRKEGITLTRNLNDIINHSHDDRVVQEYLENQFLLNDRKLNLRVYILMIINKGKKEIFINRLGKCIYSNKNFDENSLDREVHLTSLNVSNDIYDNNPFDFKDLKKFLGVNNYNALFNKIIHKCKLSLIPGIKLMGNFEKTINSLNFQLFGLDFIMNNNLEPFLLEANKGPDMIPRFDRDYKLKKEIYLDTFNIINLVPKKYNNYIKIF